MRNVWKLGLSLSGLFLVTACGQQQGSDATTKIIGGSPVDAGMEDARQFGTVALTTDFTGASGEASLLDQGHSFCTGTIIGPRKIVTAAHCLQKIDPDTQEKSEELNFPNEDDFLVFFGLKVNREGTWIRAQKVIPHPDWDVQGTLSPFPRSPAHDIGVIILQEDIPEGYQPVRIASELRALNDGDEVFLAGYGVTKSRNTNDTGTLRQVKTKISSAQNRIRRIMLGRIGRGGCAGDSGGPAYIRVQGEWQLVGATSAGPEIFSRCLGTNLFTDVRFYKRWLKRQG